MCTNSIKIAKGCYTSLIYLIPLILMFPIISLGKTYSFDFSSIPAKEFSVGKIASIKNSALLADSTKTGSRWNNYLISNPKSLPIPGGHVCVVEFDYKIIKKAVFPHDHGYFYFFIRTPKGTKFDKWKRWEGTAGTKGHKRYIIELPNQPGWRIYFGIKGQGIIEIDNLKISDFPDIKTAQESTPFYVHIGFEDNEPKIWSILQNSARVVRSPSGNYLLADTTKDRIRVWRRYLQLSPSSIGLEKNTTYSVQFKYEIIESPSYFQLLERGSRGWRLILSWSGPKGHKGEAKVIFTSDEKRACPLIFGMKGPGAIIIDDIVIRRWKNEQEAKEGLQAENITRDQLKQEVSKIKAEISKVRVLDYLAKLLSKINDIESKLTQSSFTTAEKLKLYKMMQNIKRDIFKLRVMNDTSTWNSAFVTFVDDSLRKIRRDAHYDYKNKPISNVELWIAGNEYESFQIIIVPFRDISGLSLKFSDLKSNTGTIGKENIKWYKVEYVDTKKKLYPVKYVGYWPDPLEPVDKINIPASQYVQPI